MDHATITQRTRQFRNAVEGSILPKPLHSSAVTPNWCRGHQIQCCWNGVFLPPAVLFARFLDNQDGYPLFPGYKMKIVIGNLLANTWQAWSFRVPWREDPSEWFSATCDALKPVFPAVIEAFDKLAEQIEMEPT